MARASRLVPDRVEQTRKQQFICGTRVECTSVCKPRNPAAVRSTRARVRLHPHLVLGDPEPFWQGVRARGEQDIQRSAFRDASERGVGRTQSVISSGKLCRNRGKYVNAKRRTHRQCDHREVEKHDSGLAEGVKPKMPNASQVTANDQAHSHRDFQEQNQIGSKRRRTSKQPFFQWMISVLALHSITSGH